MVEWNVRKRQILELAEKYGEITSKLVAEELGIPLQHASVRLMTYARDGYLKRDIAPADGNPFRKGRPSYGYKLTKRGKERLEYLRSLEQNKKETIQQTS